MARTTEESARVFENAYQEASCDPSSYFNQERRNSTARLQVDLLGELLPINSHIVDIGGGNGYFAREAGKRGYTVTLVDPSLKPEEFISEPLEVLKGTLEAVKRRKFACVTLWDVIEHVPEPDLFLSQAASLLDSDGLLIIETGNYLSADRFKAYRNHWIIQADHRWYFSPKSINRLLENTGFLEPKVVPRVIRPGWSGTPHYLPPGYLQLIKALLKQPQGAKQCIAEFQRSQQAAKHAWAGLEIFTVVAKKS